MTKKIRYAPNNVVLEFLPEWELDTVKAKAIQVISSLLCLDDTSEFKISTLQATVKSQVFVVNVNSTAYVIKLHNYDDNYAQELLAYFLLDGSPIPTLIFYSVESRAMVLSYVDGRPFQHAIDNVFSIAALIGKCHGIAQANLYNSHQLRSLLNNHKNAQIVNRTHIDYNSTNSGKYQKVSQMYTKVYGDHHTSICIGDLKPEHCLYVRYEWITIDIETISTGMLEVHDLLSLINFVPSYTIYKKILPKVLRKYADSYSKYYRPINSQDINDLIIEYEDLLEFEKSLPFESA